MSNSVHIRSTYLVDCSENMRREYPFCSLLGRHEQEGHQVYGASGVTTISNHHYHGCFRGIAHRQTYS